MNEQRECTYEQRLWMGEDCLGYCDDCATCPARWFISEKEEEENALV